MEVENRDAIEDKHVLIVDDDEPLRRMLETSFRKEGFLCVNAAGDGASALAKCRALSPDLVVLDVMLPDRDGFSICHLR